MRARRHGGCPPGRQARQARETRTRPARVGSQDGQDAAQDPGGLPALPRGRPRNPCHAHGVVAGEPVAVKAARRVRRKAAPLPRVPANPRVHDGELRGIHAVWADSAPGFVRTLGSRGHAAPRTRVPPRSFLPPPPDDPLPDGQVKGTLRVSLRDRCATPDMPVRSQDRQLSGSGRKTGQADADRRRAPASVHKDCKTVISGDDPSCFLKLPQQREPPCRSGESPDPGAIEVTETSGNSGVIY